MSSSGSIDRVAGGTPISGAPHGGAPSPKIFWLALSLYFLTHTLIRANLSSTLDLDESEQLILTQKFNWGYGSQPPLYTWLQMGFFKVFGVSVMALAALKNLLLFGIYAFTYLNVREVTRSHAAGVLGACALLFIPQVSWESQRDLTHSVLASTCVTATMFAFLRARVDSWKSYVGLGAIAALGVLSKYNYLAVLFGLCVASLTLPQFRPLILNPRIASSLGIFGLFIFPHVWWAALHRESLVATAYKFDYASAQPYAVEVARGFAKLFGAVVAHVAPLCVVFAAFFWKTWRTGLAVGISPITRLLFRKYCAILGGLAAAIIFLRVTGFKDRWFEPIFITLPLLLWAGLGNSVQGSRAKGFAIAGGIVASVILLVIPSRIIWAEQIGQTQLLNAPYSQLKAPLAEMIEPGTLVIAESKWVGGNLRLQFPGLDVVTPELAALHSPKGRHCLLVWETTRRAEPKEKFRRFVRDFAGSEIGPVSAIVSAPYQFHGKKTFRLAVAPLAQD